MSINNADSERIGKPRASASTNSTRPFYYEPQMREESEWTPWLVPMIFVANVVMFVVVMGINDCPDNNNRFHININSRRFGPCVAPFLNRFSFQPLRENPLVGPSSYTLEKLGALNWDKIVNQHEGWRLVTCIWLHAGVIHLVANMLSLLFIGVRLEQQFGFIRIGAIYLISGFGGSVLSTLFTRNSISVGASGALFGILGAMLSELFTNWSIYTNKVGALLTLVVIVALNLAVGMLPRVDTFAHVGGFITGFLLGFSMLMRPQFGWYERHMLPSASQVKYKYKVYQYILCVVSLLALVAGLSVVSIMVFRGKDGKDWCHWCRYLSCIPTSRWRCAN